MSTRSLPVLTTMVLAAATLGPPLNAQASALVIEEARAYVVPVRSADAMRRDREEAAVAEQVANDSAGLLRVEVSRARARIDIHKSELETIKKRLELAKKEKRESDRLDLDNARKAKETDLRLLERVRSMQEARQRLAEAQRDAARAAKRAVESEQTLEARRAEQSTDEEVRRTTRRVLELQRDAASQKGEMAARARDLAQRQLEVLDAQAAVLGSAR